MHEPPCALGPISGSRGIGTTASRLGVPALIADAGDRAARRFLEFFAATIRNTNTSLGILNALCQRIAPAEPLRTR